MPSRIASQRHKINRAVNYIRGNFSSGISLGQIADAAHLSKYHFNRVFANYLQETPNQYLVRLKLEQAAKQLLRADPRNLTQLAIDCGFSSSDSFSRAFRQRFNYSPRTFKKQNHMWRNKVTLSHQLESEIIKTGTCIFTDAIPYLSVRIEQRPKYHVAYLRHLGPYGDIDSSITNTFTRLQQWAESRGILTHRSSFLGRGADNCNITPARHCMYDTCIVLDNEVVEDELVSVQSISGGTYAVLETTCEAHQLNRVWDWLNSRWLPQSGKLAVPGPAYEFFAERGRRPIHSSLGVQICLPISSD